MACFAHTDPTPDPHRTLSKKKKLLNSDRVEHPSIDPMTKNASEIGSQLERTTEMAASKLVGRPGILSFE